MASIVRSGSTVFHLSSSAPPRLCPSQGTLWRFNPTREGRPPRRPKAPAVGSTVPLTVLSQVSAPSASMPALRSNFQVCSLLPQVSAPEPQCQLAVASIVRSGSSATDTANTASRMGGTTSASSVDSLPSQPFITPLGASLFLHLPRGHPVQSPFASLRANLRFTPDSFHSLPLRRGSEASSHCRASSALPTLSPLLLLYFQLSHTSNAGPTSFFTLFIFS